MEKTELEHVADDLEILTGVPWSFMPFLFAPPNSYIEENLAWLKSTGAIAGYKNAGPHGDIDDGTPLEMRAIKVEGIDAAKIKTLAAEAKIKVVRAEKVFQLLQICLKTMDLGIDPAEVVLGSVSVWKGGEFSQEQFAKLRELEAANFIEFIRSKDAKFCDQIKLKDQERLIQHLEPRHKIQMDALEKRKRAMHLLGLVSGLYFSVACADPCSSLIKSEGISQDDHGYAQLVSLRKQGVISFKDQEQWSHDGEARAYITVTDHDRLEELSRSHEKDYKELLRAAALLRTVTGHYFCVDSGNQIITRYYVYQPNTYTLKEKFEELKKLEVIDFEEEYPRQRQQGDDDIRWRAVFINMDKLKAYAADAAANCAPASAFSLSSASDALNDGPA